MTNTELEKFIEKIEQKCPESEAYFEVEYNPDFSFAKGNKIGLLLYANELLKAAREIDHRNFEDGVTEMYNPNFKWIQGLDENPFSYIQITKQHPSEIDNQDSLQKKSWKTKLEGLGCATVLIFALFLTIVGLIAFIKWFF